jgi:hypothetical protein
MHERFAEITTAEGVMEAFVTQPEQNAPFPAVIVYMDIWGVRDELYAGASPRSAITVWCRIFTIAKAEESILILETSAIKPSPSTGSKEKISAPSKGGQN